ncbi:uncharacterized protein LOC142004763 [Carettochelys insculpta]|uniref:uncharacterized protein LOC142004763 n=1 Tax=Carettochelys insculpta TaxID=44489 RepID=UPI003EBE4D7C
MNAPNRQAPLHRLLGGGLRRQEQNDLCEHPGGRHHGHGPHHPCQRPHVGLHVGRGSHQEAADSVPPGECVEGATTVGVVVLAKTEGTGSEAVATTWEYDLVAEKSEPPGLVEATGGQEEGGAASDVFAAGVRVLTVGGFAFQAGLFPFLVPWPFLSFQGGDFGAGSLEDAAMGVAGAPEPAPSAAMMLRWPPGSPTSAPRRPPRKGSQGSQGSRAGSQAGKQQRDPSWTEAELRDLPGLWSEEEVLQLHHRKDWRAPATL